MSFSTDMLTAAQAAYKKALDFQMVQKSDRRHQNHEIDKLRGEVEYWQSKVDAETARAGGKAYRKPIQVVL